MVPVTGVEPVRCRHHWILSFPLYSELDGHKVVLAVVGDRQKISPDKRKTKQSPKNLAVKSFALVLKFSKSTSE